MARTAPRSARRTSRPGSRTCNGTAAPFSSPGKWGPPSGLIALTPVRTLDAPRPFGLITTLVVAAESRRRGIGRVLLKAAGRAARQAGCDRLLLRVGPNQHALRAFCEAAGFTGEAQLYGRPLLKRGSGEA